MPKPTSGAVRDHDICKVSQRQASARETIGQTAHVDHTGHMSFTIADVDTNSVSRAPVIVCSNKKCDICTTSTPVLKVGVTYITHHKLPEGQVVTLPRPCIINGTLRYKICVDQDCKLCTAA